MRLIVHRLNQGVDVNVKIESISGEKTEVSVDL